MTTSRRPPSNMGKAGMAGRDFTEVLLRKRLVGVVRAATPEQAFEASKAAFRGGIEILEVTLTVPDAAHVIADLSSALPGAVVGAGSVTGVAQAEAAQAAGAA